MFKKFGLPFSLAVLLFVGAATAQTPVAGEAIDVIDGRTVVIALTTGKVKVELQFIDVPEPGQDLHQTVKDHLRHLVIGKIVTYRPRALYDDRTIGLLQLNDIDISQQMLRDGAAWHTPTLISGQDKSEFAHYASIETTAKNEKRGVWSISGLRPAWELRAERKERELQQKQDLAVSTTPATATTPAPAPKAGMWADKNPSLGNVGALVNGYNAETKTGYLATSLLGVNETDKDKANEHRTAVDITYYYKEDDKKGRKGVFIVSVVSVSKTVRFLKNNDLVMMIDGKNLVIGKAKLKTQAASDSVQEQVTYEVDRTAIEKIVNGGTVMLRISDYVIQPSNGLQLLLYNMLQLSA